MSALPLRLQDALAPVLRDWAAAGGPPLRILPVMEEVDGRAEAGRLAAAVYFPDGSATGVHIHERDEPEAAIREVAELLQEAVLEEFDYRFSSWPSCPLHPNTHPLEARMQGAQAHWCCPRRSDASWRIGALAGDALP